MGKKWIILSVLVVFLSALAFYAMNNVLSQKRNITAADIGNYVDSGDKAEYSWNQRVTLTVDTDGGPISSSSVMKVAWFRNNATLLNKAASPWIVSIQGAMPFLELPDGTHVFSLFSRDGNSKLLAWHLLGNVENSYDITADKIEGVLSAANARVVIPSSANRFPILVRFGDISAPESIVRFIPKSATVIVETTNEEISGPEIHSILPWLSEIPEISTSTSRTAFRLAEGKSGFAVATQSEFYRGD